MNARNITFAAGIGLLYLMIGALLVHQYRAPATLTEPDLTAAVHTAIQPLNDEVAKLNVNVAQLSGRTQLEKNAEFLAAVEKAVKPVKDQVAALSKLIDPANFVTKTDLEAKLKAESQALSGLIETNKNEVASILRGEKSGNLFANQATVKAVRTVTAANGHLRVINTGSQEERLRVGSVMFRVPGGRSSLVVPAGTVISSLNGRRFEMPEEGGLTLEFFRGSVHRLNGT